MNEMFVSVEKLKCSKSPMTPPKKTVSFAIDDEI